MKERRIVRTPGVCGGRACVAGTRIAVWTLEAWRRLGTSDFEILASFPAINTDDLAAVWAYVAKHPDEIASDIRAQDEGEEFDKFCDSLDQETLDEMVHEAKSEEAAAINNDGKSAQVNYLLGNGFTRETLRAQCAAAAASAEEGGAEVFAARLVKATDAGIKEFGSYTFRDKGADEVMDINGPADESRGLSAETAGEHLEALARRGKTYKKVADAILGQLDDMDEGWWEACCTKCPSVEY